MSRPNAYPDWLRDTPLIRDRDHWVNIADVLSLPGMISKHVNVTLFLWALNSSWAIEARNNVGLNFTFEVRTIHMLPFAFRLTGTTAQQAHHMCERHRDVLTHNPNRKWGWSTKRQIPILPYQEDYHRATWEHYLQNRTEADFIRDSAEAHIYPTPAKPRSAQYTIEQHLIRAAGDPFYNEHRNRYTRRAQEEYDSLRNHQERMKAAHPNNRALQKEFFPPRNFSAEENPWHQAEAFAEARAGMTYTLRRVIQAWRVGCAGKQALHGIQRPSSMEVVLQPNASKLFLLKQYVPEFNWPPYWTFNTPNGIIGMYRETGGLNAFNRTLDYRFPTDAWGRNATREYWKLANTMPLWAWDNTQVQLDKLRPREPTGFTLGEERWAHMFNPPMGNEIEIMSWIPEVPNAQGQSAYAAPNEGYTYGPPPPTRNQRQSWPVRDTGTRDFRDWDATAVATNREVAPAAISKRPPPDLPASPRVPSTAVETTRGGEPTSAAAAFLPSAPAAAAPIPTAAANPPPQIDWWQPRPEYAGVLPPDEQPDWTTGDAAHLLELFELAYQHQCFWQRKTGCIDWGSEMLQTERTGAIAYDFRGCFR